MYYLTALKMRSPKRVLWAKFKVFADLHSFWRLWERVYFLAFFSLQRLPAFLACGPVLHFQRTSLQLLLATSHLCFQFCVSCLLLIKTHMIMLGNLGYSSHLKILTAINMAVLPWKLTYSQSMRIGTWTSLGGHDSVYHKLSVRQLWQLSGERREATTSFI